MALLARIEEKCPGFYKTLHRVVVVGVVGGGGAYYVLTSSPTRGSPLKATIEQYPGSNFTKSHSGCG